MFADTVTGCFEEDVLASNLYIQSGKSIRNARFVGGHKWRQLHTQAMVSFGYTVIRYEDESLALCPETSPWQAIKDRLLKHVSEAAIDDAKYTLDALANTHPKACEVLRIHALHGVPSNGSVCLPPSPVTDAQRTSALTEAAVCPALVTVSLLLSFAAAAPVINLAFLSFKTALAATPPGISQLLEAGCPVGQLELSLVTAELDDIAYSRFRPAIVQQLGSRLDEQLVCL